MEMPYDSKFVFIFLFYHFKFYKKLSIHLHICEPKNLAGMTIESYNLKTNKHKQMQFCFGRTTKQGKAL